MIERTATVSRVTRETEVSVTLALDGSGRAEVQSGVGFMDHLLELLAKHSLIDLKVNVKGDLEVDEHHSVEDLAIGLGQALRNALGEKEGIERYGYSLLPMDEVLVAAAIDLGGRFSFCTDYRPVREKVGQLSTEMVNHFFQTLAVNAGMNLHFCLLRPGDNEHHRLEALFKSFARALRQAVKADPQREGQIPSTKGVL